MKPAVFLGALVALLGSTTAARLHHKAHNLDSQIVVQDSSEKDQAALLQPAEYTDAAKQNSIHSPPSNNLDAILVDIDEFDQSGDAGPFAHHSPHPKFNVGSKSSQWAIAYVPYTDDLNCKSRDAIQTDVATIAQKGFTTIRLYATDCSALKLVGSAAKSHNLNLILGVHIDDPTITHAQSQIDDIIAWADGNWDSVEMIVIGNEAIFNEFVTPNHLADFIANARPTLRRAGYTGPVTTTEPISTLHENVALLCPVIDIAAANIHPFFHADVSAEMAGAYVADQLEQVEGICPGLQAVNLETGWPSQGMANGEAVPGVMEQMLAVTNIMKSAGGRSVFLGFGNDGWKDEGEFGVEQSWGCMNIFRNV
ncbi:hypothetical protein ACLMJK_007012 [Lecanora helva]